MTRDRSSPPSMTVVSTVAEREGVDPMDLQPPLWDRVDPDALDRLFADRNGGLTVEFEYLTYTVRVEADGEVTVDETPGPVGSGPE